MDLQQLYFFNTNNNSYVYDNNTGYIVPFSSIDKEVFKAYSSDISNVIRELEKTNINKDSILESYDYVSNLIKCGLFKKCNGEVSEDNYESLVKIHSSRLVLIVTEDCNMRCKYCVFSDHYEGIKSYSEKAMSFDVACRAIEIFMKLHAERLKYGLRHKPTITFYGGEPLLNYRLIKRIIKYCNNKNYDVLFLITTNGLLLNNNKIVETLVDNDVFVTISLDGDKEETDRKRVVLNGAGSYNAVMSGIENYKKILSKKKKKNMLLFSSCFDPKTDIYNCVQFFESNKDLFENYYVMSSQVNPTNTTYYSQFNKTDDLNFQLSAEKLKNDFFEAEKQKKYGHYKKYSIFTKYGIFKLRTLGPAPVIQKTCVIGSRMAVDPDGKIYICERVNQQLPFGDVFNGIDYKRMYNISYEFNRIRKKQCSDCNVSRLCDVCYSHFVDQESLKFNNDFCIQKKQSIYNMIKLAYETLEINSDAFHDLYSKEVSDTH